MNILFTEKEISVIQLIVPELTPEQTCNKVLRDWFSANLPRLQNIAQPQTTDEVVDKILVNSDKITQNTVLQ